MLAVGYMIGITILIATLFAYALFWGNRRVIMILSGLMVWISAGLTIAAIPAEPRREIALKMCETAVDRAYGGASSMLAEKLKAKAEKHPVIACKLFKVGCE